MELQKDKFVCLALDEANDDISFELTNAVLKCPRLKLNDSVYLEMENKLQHDVIRMYHNKVDVSVTSLASANFQ